MSGCGFEANCPNCGQAADAYEDTKPFEHTEITCPHCGFYTNVEVGFMNLEELNDLRVNVHGDEPLEELPEQNFEY
jgi:hypothetical protein